MFSPSLLPLIKTHEDFLGHSDQCHSCGRTFLAHSDGCPHCGSSRTSSLTPPLQLSECKVKEGNGSYAYSWSKEEGLRIVNDDQDIQM